MSLEIVTEIISILFIATLIDITLGEPPNRIHPVVLIGRIINFFIKIIKNTSKYMKEKDKEKKDRIGVFVQKEKEQEKKEEED